MLHLAADHGGDFTRRLTSRRLPRPVALPARQDNSRHCPISWDKRHPLHKIGLESGGFIPVAHQVELDANTP